MVGGRELVAIAVAGLLLPASACGGSAEPAILEQTDIECRESAVVDVASGGWKLAEPAPLEWKDGFPLTGTLQTGSFGRRTVFVSDDGVQVEMIGADEPSPDSCTLWES